MDVDMDMDMDMDVDIIQYDKSDNNNVFAHELLEMMMYFQEYLDDQWCIKKKMSYYVLTKNKRKIIVSDSIFLSKIDNNINDYHKMNENTDVKFKRKNKNNELFEDDNPSKEILYFMYNVLNNGWTIKKSNKMNEKYIFLKNHEGKKEFFSNNYIHTFLKENFIFKLIK